MTQSLSSLPDGYRAVVFGATGAIGSALLTALAEDPRCAARYAASRAGRDVAGAPGLAFDLAAPDSIEAVMEAACADGPAHLVIAATGALHSQGALEPEKTWRHLDARRLAHAFEVNTVLPSLIARATLPRLARGTKDAPEKAVFAALSARVGSISDNRLGGWHAYRASKAALNQIIKTCSIELARKAPHALCVGLHPGTVDSALSKPFQGNVPDGKLFTPAYSAGRLLSVIDGLGPDQSGRVFDWAGAEVPA
jgi:Dehydrogenases with different specificities (related to short-chain alcohol dehydrogenases)